VLLLYTNAPTDYLVVHILSNHLAKSSCFFVLLSVCFHMLLLFP